MVVEGRQWVWAATPFSQWNYAFTGSMILPRLRGHRRVHIVLWNDIVVPCLPTLMQALATGGGAGGSLLLQPQARLEHITVTALDPNDLVYPGRTDILTARSWGLVRERLQGEATALGIELEFNVHFLSKDNLGVLDSIQSTAGEAVAFCGSPTFNKSSEDPKVGNGSRIRVMQVRQGRYSPTALATTPLPPLIATATYHHHHLSPCT